MRVTRLGARIIIVRTLRHNVLLHFYMLETSNKGHRKECIMSMCGNIVSSLHNFAVVSIVSKFIDMTRSVRARIDARSR